MQLAERLREARFLIVGRADMSAQLPENIELLGMITDPKLMAVCYSIADVTVLTSRRETFSMVCAESLCCGTPVAGFNAGGPESVFSGKNAKFCTYGDLDALISNMKGFWKDKDAEIISTQESVLYNRETMIDSYIQLYTDIVKGG